MRKLLISREIQKNLLCFANCKKPIKKARKNFNRRESFSSFLIIGDTRKYGVVPKPFFVRPHCPPLPPPFPPNPVSSSSAAPIEENGGVALHAGNGESEAWRSLTNKDPSKL